MNSFEKELVEMVSQRTGLETGKIKDATDFEHDLNLSRDELVAFLGTVETAFKVSFLGDNLDEIRSIGDLKNLLLEKLEIYK